MRGNCVTSQEAVDEGETMDRFWSSDQELLPLCVNASDKTWMRRRRKVRRGGGVSN